VKALKEVLHLVGEVLKKEKEIKKIAGRLIGNGVELHGE